MHITRTFAETLQSVASDSEWRECEVLLCDMPTMRLLPPYMPKLRWAQCTWAGVDSLFEPVKVVSKMIHLQTEVIPF